MILLNLKDFMEKYSVKNDTMNESHLQEIYNYPIYPRDSKYIHPKDSQISIKVVWGVLTGHVFQ